MAKSLNRGWWRGVCLALGVWLIGAIVVVPVFAQYEGAEPVPEELRPGFDSITPEQSRKWLSVIAGPEFEGRGTGQVGYTKAAHYVAGKLAEWNLEPLGAGGSYFQMLPMTRRIPVIADSRITGPNDLVIEGERDLGFQRYSDQAQASGDVVFVAISGTEAALPSDVSLRDKVVVFAAENIADFRAQALLARQQPAAVISIAEGQPRTASEVVRRGRRATPGLWCTISESAAEQLFESLGAEREWLTPPEGVGVKVNETDERLSITVRLREEPLAVPNVVAWLEGSDPEVNHEYIVIGAHLDHLGMRGDVMYPGADDNGSGSTAVLNVARALTLNPVRPRRSVLFIWFAAEEIGLVGSRHYVDNPAKPLENAICMLNMDMVGRNHTAGGEGPDDNYQMIHLVGSRRGDTPLHDIVLEANQHVNFEFSYEQEGVFGRSDQASFYRAGMPVAFVFSGFHPDYHQPGDTIDKINYDKISNAAKLFYLTIFKLAEHGPLDMQTD